MLRKWIFVLVFGIFLFEREKAEAKAEVVLRGLDKITARITTITVPVDVEVSFRTLRIVARSCYKRPPEEPPEVSAFLQIFELRPGDPERRNLFSGWMFASSPALSALEHPVYDVWVIDCSTSSIDGALPLRRKSFG